MSGGGAQSTITSAPFALPIPSLDGGDQPVAVKEEVLANGTVIAPSAAAAAAAGVKRKLDPAEEAKLRELEYKKRCAFAPLRRPRAHPRPQTCASGSSGQD